MIQAGVIASGFVQLAAPLAAPHRAPEQWPQRLALVGVLLVLLLLGYLGMWRGWRRRAVRHADLPPLPAVPAGLTADRAAAGAAGGAAGVPGMYVSTTLHGDWLERVVAHGLGGRGEAVATVTGDGILLARTGEPDLFVPVGALREVRREAGQVGKFVEEGGLVVLTWEHGGRLLDTAFRTRRAEARPLLTAAATALLGSTTPHPPTGTEDGPTAGPITTPGTTSHTTTLAAAGTTGARKEQQ